MPAGRLAAVRDIIDAVRFPRIRPGLSLLVVAISFLILLVAAFFLYRWINHLSELDQRGQQEHLDASVINLEREFSVTLREAVRFFRLMPSSPDQDPWRAYSEQYVQWEHAARWPQLVSAISVALKPPRGGMVVLRRLNPRTYEFEAEQWPAELSIFRQALMGSLSVGQSVAGRTWYSARFVMEDDRLIVAVPIFAPSAGRPRGVDLRRYRFLARARPAKSAAELTLRQPRDQPYKPSVAPGEKRARDGRPADAALKGWCFLEYNRPFIQTTLLPFLVGQYFGPAGLAKYNVAVFADQRVVYSADPAATAANMASPDAQIELLGSRERPRLPAPWIRRGTPDGRRWIRPPSQILRTQNRNAASDPAAWRLEAKNKLGSIHAAAGVSRRRNLAIGFGTLLLLGCGMSMLVIAAHRARNLVRRQMEFVAGVSHELRTPLAVIDSAAFNLARGTVEDAGRVRQYGEVIQRESERLSDLIGLTLQHAAVQQAGPAREVKPTRILGVVEDVLREYDSTFREKGWLVEKRLESALPLVSADSPRLKSAIRNVVENALKYAPDGKWLGISARAAQHWRGTEVQISIADRGPGIDPADLPHIFKPFYRGRRMVASPLPGTGLGLSLATRYLREQHGRISVRTSPTSGTEFTLHLRCSS